MPTPETSGVVRLSVCYARPDDVYLEDIDVPAGTTIIGAIRASGLVEACPEVDPSTMRVGIFGKLKTLDTVVRAGDRVEIYRPLTADPMLARRKRVQQTRKSGTREGQKWLRRKAGQGD